MCLPILSESGNARRLISSDVRAAFAATVAGFMEHEVVSAATQDAKLEEHRAVAAANARRCLIPAPVR
ncbi:MAG: hypothetical protein ACE5EF_07075 [Dehalococcoidia bacterium]